MNFVAIVLMLAAGQSSRALGHSEFQVMGRQWLHEAVVLNAASCATSRADKAKLTLRLNVRGEVAVLFHSVSSPTMRACIELLALPSRQFAKDVDVAELSIAIPESREDDRSGTIVDEVPPRAPKESGSNCKKHEDCGAGQICAGFGGADAGQSESSRCIDLQRWLVARSK